MPRSLLIRALHWLRAYALSDQSLFFHLAQSQRHAG